MDDPEATTLHFSLSKEDASDSISYPTINKQRKSSESKLKLSQICDTSPDPDFRTELVVYDSSKESRSRRKRAMIDDLYDHSKVHSPVIEQAEELRANLEASFPSFWKAMVKSNVTHGFWLHLPMRFCKLHMPKTDTVFTLENESGGEYKVNYISQRTALSGGWKAFCDSNGLNESDVLVFHLIAPLRFKVFIVRANGISNVTAEAKPLNLVPLDIDSEAKINDQTEKEKKSKKRAKQLKSPGFIQHDIQNSTLMVLETTNGHVIDQFENGRVDLGPITSEGLQSSESPCNFKEVKSVDNFTILVNDLAIDSELSDHHRTKYYELCSSQNSFLHNHLLKSINCKLAAEIITQTVNIAEAVRACNLSTSRADYEVWDKTLKGFELLGMNVSFLRARLNRLMSFTLESEESMELKRLKEVTVEKSCAEEEMRALELKLLTLKETMGRLDYKVESLKAKAETHALKFQEEVNAPW